ncbi:MAG: hypothetical protein OXB98_11315 [Bryobacterales bacterium]|nr:hypothetical protein [Bryobacterales bacterium]
MCFPGRNRPQTAAVVIDNGRNAHYDFLDGLIGRLRNHYHWSRQSDECR